MTTKNLVRSFGLQTTYGIKFGLQLLLLCVGILYVMFGSLEEGATAFVVIFLMIAAEVGTEWRAKRALASLKISVPRDALVRRDYQVLRVPASYLVPGDIVHLEAGMVWIFLCLNYTNNTVADFGFS